MLSDGEPLALRKQPRGRPNTREVFDVETLPDFRELVYWVLALEERMATLEGRLHNLKQRRRRKVWWRWRPYPTKRTSNDGFLA